MIQRALQCCKLGDRFVEDPVPRFSSTGAGTSAATAPASAPNRNPEKELGDVGQQPQRRPGGSSLHGCASRPIATFISIRPRRWGASFRERRSACMVAVTARCTQGFGIGEVLEGLAQSLPEGLRQRFNANGIRGLLGRPYDGSSLKQTYEHLNALVQEHLKSNARR
jgi:hypothetical protein